MSAATEHAHDVSSGPAAPRALPPVSQLATGSLALIVVGGIYLASNLSHRDLSLAPAYGLLGAAAVLLAAAVIALARLRDFAWSRFFQVASRALLAYIVVAGMLVYVFAYDHTPAKVLTVLTLMLVVFMVDVPIVIGFTVARYARPAARSEPA